MDQQIIKRFEVYQKKHTKYSDLDFSKVTFKSIDFSDSKVFNFVKGQNKYIQNYIKNRAPE